MSICIVGAGLAGSEAAWQLAGAGVDVTLHEMRPAQLTRAHKTGLCAELVCSNSFRGASLTNAVGLLKEELRRAGSLIMQAAHFAEVPAGGALAVDRERFSAFVDEKIRRHPRITLVEAEVKTLPEANTEHIVIIATGPLTSSSLAKDIEALVGQKSLAFYDAISPILMGDSIDFSKLFRASRYGKGLGEDYWNIPLNEDEYNAFVREVAAAEKHTGHEHIDGGQTQHDVQALDEELRPFEGCMPIEDMVERGPGTLRFGPLKPVGLDDPRTGRWPHAVCQLRQDNTEGTLWSMVGMQTRMKHGEQLRIFRTLPGLENAEFVRLGTVHRNTFIESPRCLNACFQLRQNPYLFFAGQVTGVEGYVESSAGGLMVGLHAARLASGGRLLPCPFPTDTAMGALAAYVSDPQRQDFQPMNISFGLIPSYFETLETKNLYLSKSKKLGKDERRCKTSERALQSLEAFLASYRPDSEHIHAVHI